MHQFCLYARRYVPETHVPDPLFGRLPIPRLKAHIITPSQMRQVLDAVAVVAAGSRWTLRPHTCRTLFTLLYTTGLRISEARALQVGDVDLRRRVIKIRETKFYKSRFVPFSDGLLPILRDYHGRRIQLLGAPPPEAPFFVTQYSGHYKKTHLGTVWKRLMRHTGLGGGRGVGPRIHDLRHSFATLRLAAWYREKEVRIFDYVDREVPMLMRMFEKRLRGYRGIGYARGEAPLGIAEAGDETVVEYDEQILQELRQADDLA